MDFRLVWNADSPYLRIDSSLNGTTDPFLHCGL
jgi:hypothetical protein